MIRLERHHNLSNEMWEQLRSLYKDLDKQPFFSDPLIVKTCLDYWALNGKTIILLVAFDEMNKPVGILALYKTKLQFHGMRFDCFVNVTYPVADHNPIICMEKHLDAFVKVIIPELRQLMLPCFLLNVPERDKNKFCSNNEWIEGNRTVNPHFIGDINHLSTKKSLVRHYNKFLQSGEFTAEHYHGKDCLRYFDSFVTMHKQRWLSTGVMSCFYDKEIIGLYKAIATAPISEPNLCILTVLKFKDHVLAFHLGFMDATAFLWHSPCFDISFLPEWPGEVLLKSVLDYVGNRGKSEFDLGIGDEWYKSRFANNSRYCYSVIFFPRLAIKYQYIARRIASHSNIIRNVFTVLSKVKSKSFAILFSAIFKRIYSKIIWYNLKCESISNTFQHNKFMQVTYYDLAEMWKAAEEKPPYPPSKSILDRFKANWKLFAYKDGLSISFGWVVPPGDFYVCEVMATVTVPINSIVIVDCWTSPTGRGKGLYRNLLSGIVEHFNDVTDIFIYAESHNIASLKGIEKAGGRSLGHVRRLFKNITSSGLTLEIKC